MRVTKMHALGNCYIYVEEKELVLVSSLPELAVAVSDVRKGIGSDGLITIGPSTEADVCMRIFNADGSEAENCGNGVRCVAKYAYDNGLVKDTRFRVETKSGIVDVWVHCNHGEVDRVTVNMGKARFGPEAVGYTGPELCGVDVAIEAGSKVYDGRLVSMGNPHFVTFVEDASRESVAIVGPVIEQHPYFPNRLNVEFVTPKSPNELDFRVWERGSGITYACGTGACAAVAAGYAKGVLANRVTVHLLGGDLEIELQGDDVYMTGEAVTVFEGEYQV